jgi:hypothetical protein
MADLINLETNSTESVPDAHVQSFLGTGKYDLSPGGSVNVVNPQGKLVSLPSEDTYEAVNKYGYKFPTAPDLVEFQNQQKYGEGLGNETKAFLAGAARAGTFGLSDQALTKTGIVDPETLKQLQLRHSDATALGEFAGVGASLLAPVATPVGLLGRGAEAVTEAAGPVIAKATSLLANPETSQIASKVLQTAGQIGAKALGSSVEGAAYGLGQSVSEDALGDPDAMGERLLSNIGYTALIGGSLGGLIKAGEFALPKSVELAKEASSKLYDSVMGLPGEEPGVLSKAYAKASSFVSGKPEEQILDVLKQRTRSLSTTEEQLELTSHFSDGLKEQYQKVNKALYDANKDIRPEETARYLADYKADSVLPEYQKVVSGINDAVKTMREEPDLYPQSYPRILEKISERVSKEVTSESSALDVFNSLDSLKKRLDEEINYGTTPSGGDLRAQKEIQNLRRSIKESLENENLWGSAAARQSAFNDAQAQLLNITGKNGLFRKDFMAPAISKSGSKIYEISPSKIKTFLGQINDVRGEAKAQSLQRFLDSSNNLVNEIEKSYQAIPEKEFDKNAIGSVLQKNQDLTKKTIDQARFSKQMSALGAGAHNAPFFESGALIAGIEMHPAIGAAIESWSMLKAPSLAIQRLAKIERLSQTITNSIERGSKSLFKAGSQAIDAASGLISQKINKKLDQDNHSKLFSELNDYSNNPQKLIDSLHESTKDLYSVAPKISDGLIQSSARAVAFLQSKLPQATQQAPLSQKYEPSKAEIAKFQRYYRVVEDPMSVFDDMKGGYLTQESIDTLSTVYPKLYEQMKSSVLDKLTDHISKDKGLLPYKTKLNLSMFLNEDLDNSLRQSSIASNQVALNGIRTQNAQSDLAMQSGVKSTSKGLGKVTLSDRIETPMQSTLHREA